MIHAFREAFAPTATLLRAALAHSPPVAAASYLQVSHTVSVRTQ